MNTLRILKGTLSNPLFSSTRINYIKRNIMSRAKEQEDKLVGLMKISSLGHFFNRDAYSGSVYGSCCPDTLANIKKKDITAFYKKYFNLANMEFVMATDLDKKTSKSLMEGLLDLPAGKQWINLSKCKKKTGDKKEYILEKDKKQVLAGITVLLPGISRENFARVCLLRTLLIDGVGSKLWYIRADKQLAYSISANIYQFRQAGVINIYLLTDPSLKELAYTELEKSINDLHKNGLSDFLMQVVKDRLKHYYIRINEEKMTKTYYLGYFAMMGLGYAFDSEFVPFIQKVSTKSFNTYLKNVLKPENRVKIIISPKNN